MELTKKIGGKIMYEQELEYYDYDCIEQEVDTVKLMKPYKFVGCIENEEGVFYT